MCDAYRREGMPMTGLGRDQSHCCCQLTCMQAASRKCDALYWLPAFYSHAGGIITGDVRVNGYPKEEKTFARVMGYVEQVCAAPHHVANAASLMPVPNQVHSKGSCQMPS